MNATDTGISPVELRNHLERMRADSTLVSLDDLLKEQPVSCVDGRNTACMIGAPGGNAGLFMQMLTAYEKQKQTRLTSQGVKTIFDAYLNRFGHFYMHTDNHALENLRTVLNPYLKRQTSESIRGVLALIKTPPENLRKALLKFLVMPDHVGCGHFRLMIEHPEAYGIRRPLVELFLMQFFEALWAKDARLIYESLEGRHSEQAVVNISIETPPVQQDSVPLTLICPHYSDLEVFVNHQEAIAYIQSEQAIFLARRGLIKMDEVSAFIDLQKKIGLMHLEATLRHLAGDLKIYEVVVDDALNVKKLEETKGLS